MYRNDSPQCFETVNLTTGRIVDCQPFIAQTFAFERDGKTSEEMADETETEISNIGSILEF